MPDMMTLTALATSTPIYVDPLRVCTLEFYDNDPEHGSVLFIAGMGGLRVVEPPEKILNIRRAAMERYG